MDESRHTICGLPVPPELIIAIESGRWKAPEDMRVYETVFGDTADWPAFYRVPQIERESRAFRRTPSESVFGFPAESSGTGVDPDLSLVIADLGPDMPVVLDYRLDLRDPRVLYFRYDLHEWVEVARSLPDLIQRLGLAGGSP